ncbi:MAG: substrate-binding domain-containing protein [Candidatus Dechloromonas phosphoritropha]
MAGASAGPRLSCRPRAIADHSSRHRFSRNSTSWSTAAGLWPPVVCAQCAGRPPGAASGKPMTETLLEALSLLGDFDHRRLAGGGRLSRARCSGRGAQCPDRAAVGGRRTHQSRAFAQRPDRRLRPAVLAGGVGRFARRTALAHCTIADSAPRSAGRHDSPEETLVVAVDTGQGLDIGRRGDADVLFAHDRAAEDKFVADDYGSYRQDVMYNNLAFIVPKDDPAKIRNAGNALKAIAASGQSFV